MFFECPRPFADLPPPRVIGILRQLIMELQDKLRRQRIFAVKCLKKKIAGVFGVAYLKDCPNISCEIRDPIAVKDFTRIIVCDIRIFNLPRVIGKLNDIAIERCLEFGSVFDVQILPCRKNLPVFIHTVYLIASSSQDIIPHYLRVKRFLTPS